MSATEQELACVHVDLLALLYRTELAVGVTENANKALTRRGKAETAALDRDAKSNLLGVKTMKEAREEAARIDAAGVVPPNAAVGVAVLMRCDAASWWPPYGPTIKSHTHKKIHSITHKHA